MRWIGDEGDFNILIADLLGPSLSDLFEFCDSKFSLKTILLLADQMICRIKYVHSKSLLHLDIKPQNFLMGTGKLGNLVHIIDFGISRQYKDQHTKEHRPCREGVPLAGTYDFISINTHLGISKSNIEMWGMMDLLTVPAPSRRDDLESLGYVLLYFLRGSLPWLSSQDTTSARHATKDEIIESIKEKKLNTPIEYLCNGLPSAFATYFNYVRSLGYDARPNYTYLRKLFSDLCAREHFSHDHMFDWTLKQFSIIHGRANQADQPPVRKRARKGRKG